MDTCVSLFGSQFPESAFPDLSQPQENPYLVLTWVADQGGLRITAQTVLKGEVLGKLDLRAKHKGLDLGHSRLELRGVRFSHKDESCESLYRVFCLFFQKGTELAAAFMRIRQHNVFSQASSFPVISKLKNFGTALASLIHLMHSGVSYSFSWPVLAFIVLSRIPGDLLQNPLSP